MKSEELAWKIRRHAIDMVHATHASHIGAILSVTDIVAVLYADIMNVDPKDPNKADRDRFVLSKGHAGVAVYAALAEMGFFPKENLDLYYRDGSLYSGHVSHIRSRALNFPPAAWDMELQSPVEWRWRQRGEMHITMCTQW